jgi:hypothetical protein
LEFDVFDLTYWLFSQPITVSRHDLEHGEWSRPSIRFSFGDEATTAFEGIKPEAIWTELRDLVATVSKK